MVCWPAVWKIISRSNYINVSISDCLRGVRQLPFRILGFTIEFYLLISNIFTYIYVSHILIWNIFFFFSIFERNNSSFERKDFDREESGWIFSGKIVRKGWRKDRVVWRRFRAPRVAASCWREKKIFARAGRARSSACIAVIYFKLMTECRTKFLSTCCATLVSPTHAPCVYRSLSPPIRQNPFSG